MNFFSRLMTFHYLKVASYISLVSIKPATVLKQKQSSRGVLEKCVLKHFEKLTGKPLCQSLFLNKIAGLWPETLIKKKPWQRCFPVNIAKFLKNTFFIEHLRCLPLVKLDPSL